MTMDFAVYYEDGSSRTLTIEKPPGYHPESAYVGLCAAHAAVQGAYAGKVCVRTARVRARLTDRRTGLPILEDETAWSGRYSGVDGGRHESA